MELSAVKTRRSREITGPTPQSVAIRGKPTLTRPREYLILERRKQEELREEANAIVNYNKQFDLKTKWEQSTDKKIQKNTIHRRMEGLLKQQQFSLEERRDQLKTLLQAEERQYLTELAGEQETTIERQAKMRERARFLREKREAERLALVEKKLDQQWRNQCEELRGELSKRHQDEVCLERGEQLRLKSEQRKIKQQEEKLYADLWDQDRLSKCAREEMESALQLERNREMLKVLTVQTAAKNEQLEEEKRLKNQEAELLREQAAIRVMEEQQEKEEKRRTQTKRKADLDYSLKLKLKKQAREAQEELAVDLKILEKMLTESTNEAMELQQRKNVLRDEMQRYRDYLATQAEEEKKKEKELDALVNEEVQKQWAKRVNQWRMEREARKKLMQDVLDTRKQQIQEKLSKIKEEKEGEQKERQKLLENFEQHRKLELKQQQEKKMSNLAYQDHLKQQMDYLHTTRELDKQQAKREIEMCKEAEVIYKQRVKDALERPHPDHIHPKRLSINGKKLV